MDDGVKIKTWTTDEPLPEQLRWKMSYRDEKCFFECESVSFWVVIRIMFQAWIKIKKLRKESTA